jgi:DNA helicase-2/ATP-dependent DNA helicase PcrA
MQNIDKIDLKLNGNEAKLLDFVTMIQSFQVINENAFFLTDHVSKNQDCSRTKDATPEGMAKVQNIEELLNGIKDFTGGKRN